MPALPSATCQKQYIINNSEYLGKEIRKKILSLVMMEVEGPVESGVVMCSVSTKEVNIDLNRIEAQNAELLAQIYRMVAARIDQLNQPVLA